MHIIGATFAEPSRAKHARDRLLAEVALRTEPQFVRIETPDVPGEAVTLLGIRVPDRIVDRVREIIEAEDGSVESDVPENSIE